MAYFATARIGAIRPDHVRADHFYADMSDYLEFPNPVPFIQDGQFLDGGLQKTDGTVNRGAFGRSVRLISDATYDLICGAGFGPLLGPRSTGFAEAQAAFTLEEPMETERPMLEQLVSRPFRDRAFAIAVKHAYGNACAMTGLKIINGGGRSEVEAAHIRPVERRGPDSIRNGIALSGTVHWMFDRGLISIGEDHSLLTAKGKVPDPLLALLNPDRRLRLPNRAEMRPHPQFLRYHRETVFKG
jgi:putative restriction endonuclease